MAWVCWCGKDTNNTSFNVNLYTIMSIFAGDMKVLVVNTSETAGGAAIAAGRLVNALNSRGVQATMLVRDSQTGCNAVTTVGGGFMLKLHYKLAFVAERLRIFVANGMRCKNLWRVDIASYGVDITHTREFREADVVHLHWVNQGMLSMKQIGRIMQSGKRVVWTMHDMWPCTAICHHAGTCTAFHTHCQHCQQLLRPSAKDLSYKVFNQKSDLYSRHRITFVACSQWLANQARHSKLLEGQRIVSIPNTYDATVFHPTDKTEARRHHRLPEKGRLLLFACQKVTNMHKGLQYLLEALPMLNDKSLGLVVVGQMAESVASGLPFTIHRMPYISNPADMAALYCAVDAFVTPSLEENLPNTIMEAMACGTPCVGFDTGGIPEMIIHQQDGYVARYRDASDLAAGISYVLDEHNHSRLSAAAVAHATAEWNEERVAKQYIEIYETDS